MADTTKEKGLSTSTKVIIGVGILTALIIAFVIGKSHGFGKGYDKGFQGGKDWQWE